MYNLIVMIPRLQNLTYSVPPVLLDHERAGNCDMGRYDASIGRNWLPPMLHDTSPCGPNCPKGGCH